MRRLSTSQLTQKEAITSEWHFSTRFSFHCMTSSDQTPREFQRHTKAQRQKSLEEMHAQLRKYISSRLQPALVSLAQQVPSLARNIKLTIPALHYPTSGSGPHLSPQHDRLRSSYTNCSQGCSSLPTAGPLDSSCSGQIVK